MRLTARAITLFPHFVGVLPARLRFGTIKLLLSTRRYGLKYGYCLKMNLVLLLFIQHAIHQASKGSAAFPQTSIDL